MKALIINSGLGYRIGVMKEHPKCMTEISHKKIILSRQLRQLVVFGIEEVVMKTGYYDQVLVDYCDKLHLLLKICVEKTKSFGEVESHIAESVDSEDILWAACTGEDKDVIIELNSERRAA